MLKGLIGGPDTPFMERRAQTRAFADAFVLPEGLRIEHARLGSIPVEWIVPDGMQPRHVLFHLHGGGYVLGNPAASRPFTTAFALAARCRVVSIDYRLAPEHRFPAAAVDALIAYRALLAEGYAVSDLAIGGESAGGGLAIATLVLARDASLPMPACAIAISPWSDVRCTAESFSSKAGVDPLLTRRALKEMADAYLGDADASLPLASPSLADLSCLPPLLIHVGSAEVLLDDARALAGRAQACGVDATLEVWPDMIHVWHMFHSMLPNGAAAIWRLAEFVRHHWSRNEQLQTSDEQALRRLEGRT